ncbi:MAG: bifunctional methylenetetrahydrofolate dehydrogenase/methenyltetrahydrofolate cyclohydrolase FolD [Planctomycetota bacterium]|nr:bifunctional methylenetetrahydrofolate dehydrogenase/methenyltetrahydrofolate cyclohydrolase FolD [Planctomycetota bacterium]MDI6786829.1 bifunctional methylenetetrahydrofolate dehydrogenase/methenyltetrahydrofolate cyclohydrolase FolD [Planctomycetota bacterium]
MAEIISGTETSKKIQAELKDEVTQLKSKGITPGLSTILVGEDEASKVYIGQKIKVCEKLGITSFHHKLPANTIESDLLNLINTLNNDPKVHGILCQLPLPKHINTDKMLLAISPDKDVDGFHLLNMGKLLSKKSMKEIEEEKMYLPCTPHGIIQLLRRANIPLSGAEAVVVGRSNIVGKPVALLLMAENSTVTICHTGTKNMAEVTRRADVLIAAIGKPKFITADMVKDGVVVIDVGVNRLPEGLCGDVDFDKVKEKAKAITPVPGGVGPMTIAMLMVNTVKAAKKLSGVR